MGALALVEEQRAGECVEDLRGDLDVPGLLQPGVPGDAYGGELGDLLPAQPGGAPTAAARQADLLGRDPLTAAAQKARELMPASDSCTIVVMLLGCRTARTIARYCLYQDKDTLVPG